MAHLGLPVAQVRQKCCGDPKVGLSDN